MTARPTILLVDDQKVLRSALGLSFEKQGYTVLCADNGEGALETAADRRIDLNLSPDLPALYVDGREIEVVLMNLIENAIKYSAPGTDIALSAERQDDQVVFCVTDYGSGIPAEHLERVFERFYRVHNDSRRIPGTGLGLAICRRIVEAHSGRIWVDSEPDVGSRFCFSLPVQQDQS